MGTAGIPQQLAGAIECERAASAITEWSPMGVPGLLQMADYTRAILEQVDLPGHELDVRTMARAGRDEVLLRREPASFEALISEAVAHEPIGSARIMSAQIAHLTEMARQPNITIRVIPLQVGWHPGWAGPFVVYDFANVPAVVHFEHYSSGAFVPDQHDVGEYRKALVKMRDFALSSSDSVDYFTKARKKRETADE